MKKLLPIAVMGLLMGGQAFAKVCDVRAAGAVGDGKTKDTAALQKAIDECAAAGGGTVQFKPGTYLTGPIEVKSNITIDLQTGATILGSQERKDYPRRVEMREMWIQPLVGVVNAKNVTIHGGGTLDGNGQPWWDEAHTVKGSGLYQGSNEHPRPMLLLIDHSSHVQVEGITVQNSAFWQIVPYYSDDLTFKKLRILAPEHSPNTDAIDPFASSHILIDHVFSSIGDDNIAIKSGVIDSPGPDSPSHDITITDCEFERGHGLSIGSELSGGAYNIHAERVHFKGTDQGIRIKSNRDRGAQIYGMTFKDITMEDVKTPILISEYYPKTVPDGVVAAAPIGRLTPFFHDFTIENVTATGATNAGYIVGLPESPVKNVVLKNVKISAKKHMIVMYAQVTGSNVSVTSEDGKPTEVAPNATFAIQ
ncbi:Glycosyl hydrolases family 28 [Granulicella pectinivorans]|uniref:Glycosyl hydrolases family 28 n=1 Tax=Granulicella pectinivorans TaxID=474950 RepID=A0A1I6KZG7_9BACT|nr:glycoside hydrolase family 28 protein [Granulicella pectinivorans]SFR96587.1 Glycosyl hydrolases family 28 [Granulicella pectinivorans]